IHTPASYGMQYIAPLLRTSDDVDLSCYLIPQTHSSLTRTFEVPDEPIIDERVELTPAAAKARATIDAQTALDYILAQPHLTQVPILLYGHSLGGGVAIDLASRNPSLVSAVVVSNTFTSVPDIVRTWPLIGLFSFVCTQKWRSIDKLRFIPTDTPILMISGRQDETVPPPLMDKLWQAAQKRGVPIKWSLHWPSTPCVSQDPSKPSSEFLPKHDIFVSLEQGSHSKFHFCGSRS
ncbi:hypothetical protein C0991_010197, partial [Blastosporella zonata]